MKTLGNRLLNAPWKMVLVVGVAYVLLKLKPETRNKIMDFVRKF